MKWKFWEKATEPIPAPVRGLEMLDYLSRPGVRPDWSAWARSPMWQEQQQPYLSDLYLSTLNRMTDARTPEELYRLQGMALILREILTAPAIALAADSMVRQQEELSHGSRLVQRRRN